MEDNLFTVTLPDIGEGVVEGEVVEWLKAEGDLVEQDEAVVIVMTDKATVELPAPKPGVLARQYVAVGEIAIKGEPLYAISVDAPVEEAVKKPLPVPMPTTPIVTGSAGVSASPAVRKLAHDLGIDLASIKGSGPGGRIVREDLKGSNRERGMAPLELPGDIDQPLVGIPRLMAENMAFSKRNIPHFSYFEAVEATRFVALRQRYKVAAMKEGIALTYIPFLVKALSLTIKSYPLLNSNIDLANGRIVIHTHHNIGIAMATRHGLIVPVLKNVEAMGLEAIIRAYSELKGRVEGNKMQKSDTQGATITLSNFGAKGGHGHFATPVLNPPEVAILAVARIDRQPMVKNGLVTAADLLHLSWSFDHRVIDGSMAVEISAFFSRLIYNPAVLISS